MNIGIDFDNTIACYDTLFQEVAINEGILSKKRKIFSKKIIRDHLREENDGEKIWMKLQGLVYGKYMHCATMMPGLANFLFSCKLRNYRIFIVSHKTEFGHFDPEKISLRSEAVKWMDYKKFFDASYFGLDKKNLYFANSRKEKVRIINQLNCDWFIDDLSEVFDELDFPKTTKKILFGINDDKNFEDRIILNSWRKIIDKIIGKTTINDISYWVKSIENYPINNIKKIPGQANSMVYKISISKRKPIALKYYPDRIIDNRPRVETEFHAFGILNNNGIKNIPKPINSDVDLNIGLYEWVEGEKISIPSDNDLVQAIDFIKKLDVLSKQLDYKNCGIASEACLSANQLIDQIENRIVKFQSIITQFPNLQLFLKNIFTPLWKQLLDERISLWPDESRSQNLPKDKQILSPSDFGFHNCIKITDGSLKFIDFDYFGWDDPVKLTADFIWHPAMKLNIKLIKKWKLSMIKQFSIDPYFEVRLNAAMPFYGMRWVLIILNEFLPDLALKSKEANVSENYDPIEKQNIQIRKATEYCEKVKDLVNEPHLVYA